MKNKNYIYYINYLKKSFIGCLYRKFILYPFLKKFINKNDQFLDYGCGLGLFLNSLKTYPLASGCDINEYFAKHCISKDLDVKHIVVNNKLDYSDSFFDVVLMDNVLEHIKNPNFLISEIYRILKNNGTLIVGVPGIKGFILDDDHKVFYDEKKLNSVFNMNNFSTTNTFHLPFFVSSKFLSKNLKSYCVYVVFKKN